MEKAENKYRFILSILNKTKREIVINSPFGHPAWIEIDLIQFKKNILNIKKHIGQTRLCLPIKANAYGHGLIPIAKSACEAGVEYLGVSCLQEGALLRHAGIQIPILVLGAIHQEQIAELIHYDLEFTIASFYKAKMVAEICQQLTKTAKVHLEIDTGMQRTGVRIDTAPSVIEFLDNHPCFELIGVYSHLATADEPQNPFAQSQIQKFKQFIEAHIATRDKKILCHIANSGGVVHFPDSYLDMVRPGILAFGHYLPLTQAFKDIRPLFSVKAKVAYFKVVPKGEGVGYGHRYTTERDTRIITIPLGYGDGLRRCLSNKAHILMKGKRYPIAGTICMDQFMVDIGQDPAYVGDIITIIGEDGHECMSVNEMGRLCETISYEILCGFNNRLPRVYHLENGSQWENAFLDCAL